MTSFLLEIHDKLLSAKVTKLCNEINTIWKAQISLSLNNLLVGQTIRFIAKRSLQINLEPKMGYLRHYCFN